MSEWNFMNPQSKANLLRAVQREAEQMFAMSAAPEAWEAPTGAGHWQVRDVIGHLVDTTESYFGAFDAARGHGGAADPLGLPEMSRYVDEGAQSFRSLSQEEMLRRIRADFEKMAGILD